MKTKKLGLTFNLIRGTVQVRGNKAIKWTKGSFKKELYNQLKGKVK